MTEKISSKDSADNVQADTLREKVETQVIGSLENSETLPDHVKQRLFRARQQALRQAQGSHFSKRLAGRLLNWRPLIPIAAVATFTGAFFFVQPFGATPELNPGWEQDSELLFSTDDFELYENLEFYAWLSEVENG